MKKFKLLYLISSLVILIPLSSCDLSLILQDSTRNKEEKIEEKEKENEKGLNEDKPQEDTPETPIETGDDYDLSIYLKDYHDNYGYLGLANDLEYGTFMQNAYSSFYDASMNLLLSKEDYELDESKQETETVKFLNIYQTDWYEDEQLYVYYQSAWSVFVSENPIFYFLSNGTMTRTQTLTETETKNGNVIKETKKTEYAFILVGYDLFNTYSARNIINKKIISLFDETKNIKDLATEYNKISEINNYLKTNLVYAYKIDGVTPEDSYWAHSIIGLLDYKKGVCECYTKSFKLLSDYYGINSISVYGKTIKRSESHAWNYVKLNDNWYGMDVTWNDNPLADQYFLCSKSKMEEDHIPYGMVYGITYQPEVPILYETAYIIL